MKYTILTLGNPEREKYRQEIRRQMRGYEEVRIEAVNGKDQDQLNRNIERHGFEINFDHWRPGEGGVWYSNINAWEYAANNDADLMVFEDDAILTKHFRQSLNAATIPSGFDFATLYTPYSNQFQKFPFRFAPVAQEHGNVCIIYSSTGAKKILSLLREEGLEWPVDIWLFKKGLSGELSGYGPAQTSEKIVGVDLEIPSNIHDDDRIEVWRPNAV